MNGAVKAFVGICVLTVAGGQTAAVPANWTGTWTLNVQKSTFGLILLPSAPAGFKIISQSLKIEHTARGIRVSGDTVFSDHSGSHSSHDDITIRLDGRETIIGPVSLSFKRIDDFTFDIISKVSIDDRNFEELSHYSFSSDGRTLTETKTQAESAANKISTSVLVFSKSSTAKF